MEHFERYLGLVFRYLGIRNRSEKEVREYLKKKQASSEMIEAIIRKLYEHKFLNDETFARSWVRARARFRPRGKRLLAMELKQKGIEKDLIDKVLAEEDEEIPNELTQAKQLISKRITKVQDMPREVIYAKLGAFLGRRGFGWETIKKAIDESLKTSNN